MYCYDLSTKSGIIGGVTTGKGCGFTITGLGGTNWIITGWGCNGVVKGCGCEGITIGWGCKGLIPGWGWEGLMFGHGWGWIGTIICWEGIIIGLFGEGVTIDGLAGEGGMSILIGVGM